MVLLGRRRKTLCSVANQLSLAISRMEKPEAVLKPLGISNLGFQAQCLSCFRQLEFQFNNLAIFKRAWYGGAKAAFTNIFGAAVQNFFGSNHEPDIEQKPRECSRGFPGIVHGRTGHKL